MSTYCNRDRKAHVMKKQKMLDETKNALDLYKYAESKGLNVTEAKRIIRVGLNADYENNLSYATSWKQLQKVIPTPEEQMRLWNKVIKKGLKLEEPLPESIKLPKRDDETVGYMLCYWEPSFVEAFLHFMSGKISKKTQLDFSEIKLLRSGRKYTYGFYWVRLHLVKNISTKRGKSLINLYPGRHRWYCPSHEVLIWHLLTHVGYAKLEEEETNLPHFISDYLYYKEAGRYKKYRNYIHLLPSQTKLVLIAKSCVDKDPIYYPKHYVAMSYEG